MTNLLSDRVRIDGGFVLSALLAIRAQYWLTHLSVPCKLCALHMFVGYDSPLMWPGPVPVGSTALILLSQHVRSLLVTFTSSCVCQALTLLVQ